MAACRLRVWKWPDNVYDVTVFLLKGSGDDAKRWLKKTFDEEHPGEWMGAKTLLISHERGCALVLWFPAWWSATDAMHLSVLAHESFHAAEFTLRERGMTLTDSSDEAYAYYIAWMFRECYRRLEKRS